MVNQMLNNKCVNRAGVCDEGPAHGSVSVNPEHCQTIIKQWENYKLDLFRRSIWNVGTLHGRTEETVWTLNQKKDWHLLYTRNTMERVINKNNNREEYPVQTLQDW